MAATAVTFLLEQVKEVAKSYPDLIAGAENEFEQLKNELNLLKTFLKDCAKNSFRELEGQIKDVVYEVEDTIDMCLKKAVEARAKNDRRSSFSSKKNYDLAKEVKSIREEKVLPIFEEANAKFSAMQVVSRSVGTEDPRSKLTREKPIRQTRVVGFEDEEKTIVEYLLEENEDRLDVIPIIGIPGQGKTTLTWKIYENEMISYSFPIRIWVNIPRKFNIRDVFLQIIRKFSPSQDLSTLEDYELVKVVRIYLEREKFLLVLDDVWSIEIWDEIKEVLPFSNGKSKVLITSREENVGYHASTRKKPHQLRFLTEDESWTLLQYEVFGNDNDCPETLKYTGKYVAKKCAGVPLTIVVVGGILMDQLSPSLDETEKEWRTVAENVSRAIQNEQRINDVVALSYNRLPDDLRDCFVYMGVFPEDYRIPVKMLMGLWIAEGFIQPNDYGKSLEQSAEDNLRELIGRNLLKPEETNQMGKVKTCRVHDMVRAFCVAKAEEEKTFKEIKKLNTITALDHLYRLCIHSDLSSFLYESPNGPTTRSFFCFDMPHVEEPEYISAIVDGFHRLRVLEMKCIKFNYFPAKFVQLIHLRYLTLYICSLKILPAPIAKLWNLQSLTVETESHSITMKANMWRMIRLRHLKTKAAIILDSKWVDSEAQHNILTLSRLSPESCTKAVSRGARNLKTLGIFGKLATVFGNQFLEDLYYLEKLKLVNRLSYEATSHDKPLALPPANCFPPHLKRLTLRNTFLEWQQMSILANIETLEALKLKDNAFVGEKWDVSSYTFSSLQLLLIENTDLVIWESSNSSFPKLRFLVVKNCESLKEIPSCLGPHLENMEIERIPRSAVESARAIRDARKGQKQSSRVANFNLKIGLACETISWIQ